MFKVFVDKAQLDRKLDELGMRARDISKPLRRFGNLLKAEAIETWRTQNFEPLKESTIARRSQQGLKSMERKLRTDVKRATARQAVAEASKRGFFARLFGLQTLSTIESRGMRNRLAALRDFEQRHRRHGGIERTDLPEVSIKQAQRLGDRELKAVAKAVSKPILGDLPKMLIVEVVGKSVRVVERTRTQWSATHNEGDTAGHGAKIPKRETLPKPDEAKLGVLVSMIKEHALRPFKKE